MLTETTETNDKARVARLEARVTTDQKAMLQHAATLSGRTLSDFVVASAQEAAATSTCAVTTSSDSSTSSATPRRAGRTSGA